MYWGAVFFKGYDKVFSKFLLAIKRPNGVVIWHRHAEVKIIRKNELYE